MKKYQEIKGDLIQLAHQGKFDLIAHGCNCWNIMKAGIALSMNIHFQCNNSNVYTLESPSFNGDYNKLGQIEFQKRFIDVNDINNCNILVGNLYTQYNLGKNLDYDALTLCLKKVNKLFKGKHIGLPLIGCGIAGGAWYKVKHIIQTELVDMQVTIVHYEKN